jgi:DUF4097 and DUF4098 domain-containing protein YvlB
MRKRAWRLAGFTMGTLALAASAWAQDTDASWLAQCREQRDGQARYCEVRPISWPAGGPIHVDARPNGGVRITGSDRANLMGSARIQAQADTEAEAQAIAGQITINTSGGTLRAEGPKQASGRSWSTSFVLSVPRQSDLEIDCVNGPVALEGVSGQIRATTVNGPISLRELGGNVQARATNGPVTIVLAGNAWTGAGLDVETRNGPVKMQVPEGYSAQLDVATVNGPLHLGIPVTVQGDLPVGRQRSLVAPIGAGGAPIRAHTTNGPLSIERR